jgi:hypothetical protein
MAKEFEHLDPDVRRRLLERGIDIEHSYGSFQAEIRVSPPPLLLDHLKGREGGPLRQCVNNREHKVSRKVMMEADALRMNRAQVPWLLKKKGKQAKVSDEELHEVYEQYQSGASMREIAAASWERWGYASENAARNSIRKLFKCRHLPVRSISESLYAKWERRREAA